MKIERRWLVIPADMVESIDFAQVRESGINSLRYSIDGTKTFVKYDVQIIEEDSTQTYTDAESGDENEFIITAGIYGRPAIYSEEYPEYNHEEILELLSGEDWTRQNEVK
jgi:hypothetical protein